MRVGRWELVRSLGRGGMAEVWLGRDPVTGEEAAVKQVRSDWMADEEGQARFLREAGLLRELRVPGLVRWLDAGQGPGGAPWIAMELLPGGTLAERIAERGPLEPREAAALGRDLARTLGELHARGVVHRDVKPANVLFDAAGGPCLADLGLARFVRRGGSLTGEGDILGTPGYLAPEQVRAEKDELCPATDVYGLGATLYCALTGDPPFRAPHARARLVQALTDDVEPPSTRRAGIPPELDAVVLRCLARAPEARYPSAPLLAAALERWLAGEGDGPAQALAPRRARRALLLLLALAVAAALALGARGLRAGPAGGGAAEVEGWAAHAEACARAGDDAGARASAERALALDPEQPRALVVRAWLFMLHREHEAALADLDRALGRDPSLAAAWARRALARSRLGRPGAVEDSERALQLEPDSGLAWLARAQVRGELGDLAGGLSDVERALALDASNPTAWLTRGYLRGLIQDHQGALADMQRGAELAPRLGMAWLQLAHARRALDDVPGALRDMQRALELDPLLEGWGFLADCLLLVSPENAERAVAAASRGIERNPRLVDCWTARATARVMRGERTLAIEDATRALALDPESYQALMMRGRALAELGDRQRARVDLLRAAELPLVLQHPELQRALEEELRRLR